MCSVYDRHRRIHDELRDLPELSGEQGAKLTLVG